MYILFYIPLHTGLIFFSRQPYDSFLYEIGLLGDGVHVDLGSYHRVSMMKGFKIIFLR